MEYVGIDLHKKESQICLLTKTGEVIRWWGGDGAMIVPSAIIEDTLP